MNNQSLDVDNHLKEDINEQLVDVNNRLKEVKRSIHKLLSEERKLLDIQTQLKERLQRESEKNSLVDWNHGDHPWSERVKETLLSVFKLQEFRSFQLSAINAVLSHQDCILLMPTGGGKSLCYQLPALIFEGITVVVTPLVSLMEDQMMALKDIGVKATFLNANSSKEHVKNVHKEMVESCSSFKLLYVTPEKLAKSKMFMTKLQKMYEGGRFSLLAIDEVHCCSQWGNDFRPDYKFLGVMKRQFPNTPVLGLTATATPSVITDVQNILNIHGCLIFKASFNRLNLKYEVHPKLSSQQIDITQIETLLKSRFNGQSGIVYCFSVKDVDTIAMELCNRGIKAAAYHAQLDAELRSSVHKKWSSSEVQVIVATVAFGMGIDKSDVRFVIHNSIPKSMENYYQESGRAGRDDQPASCILLYSFCDIFRQSTMVFTEQKGLEHLYKMVAYCLDFSRCRRLIIADHFEERWEAEACNKLCDHCANPNLSLESQDIVEDFSTIQNIIEHCNDIEESVTPLKLMNIWQGKGPSKLRPPGLAFTSHNRETCEHIIAWLLLKNFLKEKFHFTPYSSISYIELGSMRKPEEILVLIPSSKREGTHEGTKYKKRSKLSNSRKSITQHNFS